VNIIGKRRTVAEPRLLIGSDAHGRPVSTGFSFASPNCDDGFVRVGIDVEAVVAGLQHSERLVRSVHFVGLAVIQSPHVQIQRALMELQLNGVFADIRKREAALGIDPDQASAHADFGARIFVGPDIVGIRQRTVNRACDPIISAARLHGNRPRHELQTCSTRGRVTRRRLILSWLTTVILLVVLLILCRRCERRT